jgi:hypothetical protein
MQVGGLFAVFIILGLFLSMLTSGPKPAAKRDESQSDTRL